MMSKNGPNKTVAKAAQRRACDPQREAQKDAARSERMAGDEFMQWMFAQAASGVQYKDTEDAKAQFAIWKAVEYALKRAEAICRSTVEYESDNWGNVCAERSAGAIAELREKIARNERTD